MELILGYIFTFLVLICIGIPVAFALGIATLGAFSLTDFPILAIPHKMWNGLESFPLVAIPFFIFAGELMSTGGILSRILDFARLLVGRFRGAFYHINVVISMIFGGLNGSAVADASACGSLLIKPTTEEYKDPAMAAAVTACTSVVGPIIPPSIPMLIYVFVSGNVSVTEMFAAGIIPGIILGLGMMGIIYFLMRKTKKPVVQAYNSSKIFKILLRFLVAFCLPLIMIGGIVSGIFSPTEAGCIAVLYAIVIGFYVTKELTYKTFYEAGIRTIIVTAIVMIMISIAKVSTWWLTLEQVPLTVSAFLQSLTTSKYIFLLLLIMFYLIIGLFIEQAAAIIMLVPVFLPVAMTYNIDPIQFGIVTIVSLAVGLITPPVGLCVYITAGIAQTKVESVFVKVFPFLIFQVFLLIVLAFFPQIYLWVPKLLIGGLG